MEQSEKGDSRSEHCLQVLFNCRKFFTIFKKTPAPKLGVKFPAIDFLQVMEDFKRELLFHGSQALSVMKKLRIRERLDVLRR